MPRKKRESMNEALAGSLSPGQMVNYFEGLPVEYAAMIVEILQARITSRKAATLKSIQQEPDSIGPVDTLTGAPVPKVRRKRQPPTDLKTVNAPADTLLDESLGDA